MSESIKPGYLLKITTWENDADNYATIERAGLTESEAKFLIKVAENFKSANNPKERGLGNHDILDGVTLSEIIDAIADKHKASGGQVPPDWDKENPKHAEFLQGKWASDFYHDHIYELIGIWNEGELYRVFDDYEVFYVPEPIKNVTDQFKN